MEERIDSAAIIVRSVVSTLTALIVAIGLILGTVIAVSPRFGYWFYSSMGNDRGVYASADKVASAADRAYAKLSGDARVEYNLETRLPAFRTATDSGVSYFGRSAPKRVTARLYAVVTDPDFPKYADAIDLANMAKSSQGAHVYVTNEASYLCGMYVRMAYRESNADALTFVGGRFREWLSALGSGVPSAILNDGGAVALLECVYADATKPDTDALFDAFDAVCQDAELIAAYQAETTYILPAMHVAKTAYLLYQLFESLDSNRATEAPMDAWAAAYNTLIARYASV